MFGFNWLKHILKKRMRPIPQNQARSAVHRLSKLYVFLGWNFVAVLLYLTWKKHIPDGPEKLQKYVEILDVDHAHVIQFSGLSKRSEYDIDRREDILKDLTRQRMISDLDTPKSESTTTEEFVSENNTGNEQ